MRGAAPAADIGSFPPSQHCSATTHITVTVAVLALSVGSTSTIVHPSRPSQLAFSQSDTVPQPPSFHFYCLIPSLLSLSRCLSLCTLLHLCRLPQRRRATSWAQSSSLSYSPRPNIRLGSARPQSPSAPCATSSWHYHPLGQCIIGTLGRGLITEWGGEPKSIAAGDVVWISPDTKHWHGAGSSGSFSQLAITEGEEDYTLESCSRERRAARHAW